MRFELKHTFDCTPEELWAITDDPSFEARVAEVSDATREIVELREDDGVRYKKVRITVNRDLPPPMRKAIGADHISYDQKTTRKLDSNRLEWSISPMVLQGRFKGEGTTRVRAIGNSCERVIAGELTIRVPIIGPKMEKKLVDDVSASYDRAAGVIREMLAERG